MARGLKVVVDELSEIDMAWQKYGFDVLFDHLIDFLMIRYIYGWLGIHYVNYDLGSYDQDGEWGVDASDEKWDKVGVEVRDENMSAGMGLWKTEK